MGKLNTVWNYLRRYKYLFVVCFFVLVVGVVDENSFLNRYHHQMEIRSLREEIRNYTDQYNRDTEKVNQLNTDPEALVKVARERYYMKRANEDVFVFVEQVPDDEPTAPEREEDEGA